MSKKVTLTMPNAECKALRKLAIALGYHDEAECITDLVTRLTKAPITFEGIQLNYTVE